ncbi:MAG TPA: phosphopantothenoylcysteine decarboxylase, partial [Acidimicrobiales bacterium]|nr:phosphopantothenoylcysteine decarboxylase [Acidimicrobiales bacterium]
AETHEVVDRAAAKLLAKGIDVIVANDVNAPGVGFDHDTNAVTILEAGGAGHEVALTTKESVAHAILDTVARRLGDAGVGAGAQDPG